MNQNIHELNVTMIMHVKVIWIIPSNVQRCKIPTQEETRDIHSLYS